MVFNTCTIREKPDTKLAAYLGEAAARKRRDPDRVIAVGGCYAEAQRERIFELYPAVDVAFGPGSIAHLADWLGAGGVGVCAGTLRTRRPRVCGDAAAAPRAAVPGVGPGLHGLQLDVRLLHRSRGPRARAEPPPGRDHRRGHQARRRRRQGGHAARPECQLVGTGPRARHPHGVRRAPPCLRRRRGHRADPLHEPASEGLPRAGHRRDRRMRGRLRAGAPPAAVGLLAHPQGDAPHLHARALPGARRAAPGRDPQPRSRHGHHRRLPRRDRGRLRADARGRLRGRLRQRLHLRLLAAAGNRGCRDGGAGAARDQDRADGTARRVDAADRGRAERRQGGPRRAGARRGLVAHRRHASARTHAPQHDRQLHRLRGGGSTRRRPDRARHLDHAPRDRGGARLEGSAR